jgi:hypothetical protein
MTACSDERDVRWSDPRTRHGSGRQSWAGGADRAGCRRRGWWRDGVSTIATAGPLRAPAGPPKWSTSLIGPCSDDSCADARTDWLQPYRAPDPRHRVDDRARPRRCRNTPRRRPRRGDATPGPPPHGHVRRPPHGVSRPRWGADSALCADVPCLAREGDRSSLVEVDHPGRRRQRPVRRRRTVGSMPTACSIGVGGRRARLRRSPSAQMPGVGSTSTWRRRAHRRQRLIPQRRRWRSGPTPVPPATPNVARSRR